MDDIDSRRARCRAAWADARADAEEHAARTADHQHAIDEEREARAKKADRHRADIMGKLDGLPDDAPVTLKELMQITGYSRWAFRQRWRAGTFPEGEPGRTRYTPRRWAKADLIAAVARGAFDRPVERQLQAPPPAHFREAFIELGWRYIEFEVSAHKYTIERWIEECGGDELRAARAAYVAKVGLKGCRADHARHVKGLSAKDLGSPLY